MNIASKNVLRLFLVALAAGQPIEKAAAGAAGDGETTPDFFELHKAAGPVVQELRMDKNISEGTVMSAIGMEDKKQYMSFERGEIELDFTPEAMTALAKALKTDVATLAARLLSTGGGEETTDENEGEGDGLGDGGGGLGGGTDKSDKPVLSRIREKLNKGEQNALDRIMVRSRQSKSSGNGSDIKVEKSDKEQTADRRSQLAKSILGLTPEAVQRIEKNGIIMPTDFTPSGTINPSLAREIFLVGEEKAELLTKVTQYEIASLEEEILIVEPTPKSAGRWGEAHNFTTSEYRKMGGGGRIAKPQDLDLPYLISDKVRQNFKNRMPQLENIINQAFGNSATVNVEALGFCGISDDFDPVTPLFEELGIGWPQLAINEATGAKAWRKLAPAADDTIFEVLDAMILALVTNEPHRSGTDVDIIMSAADFEKYESLFIANRKSDEVLINGAKATYRGHQIYVSKYLAPRTFLYTRLKNLLYIYLNGEDKGVKVEKTRVTKADAFLLTIPVDYEIADYDACVVAVQAEEA